MTPSIQDLMGQPGRDHPAGERDFEIHVNGSRFGELLLRKQLTARAPLLEAILAQTAGGKRLGTLLVEAGAMRRVRLHRRLPRHRHLLPRGRRIGDRRRHPPRRRVRRDRDGSRLVLDGDPHRQRGITGGRARNLVIDPDNESVEFNNAAEPKGVTLDRKVNGADHATIGDALVARTLDDLTYSVTVTNTGDVPLKITALADSLYTGFPAAGDCPQGVGSRLAPGASFTCTYHVSMAGAANNVAKVIAVDESNREVSDDAKRSSPLPRSRSSASLWSSRRRWRGCPAPAARPVTWPCSPSGWPASASACGV